MRIRNLAVGAVLLLVACEDGCSSPYDPTFCITPHTEVRFATTKGNDQVGQPGAELPEALEVEHLKEEFCLHHLVGETGLPHKTVTWTVVEGGGFIRGLGPTTCLNAELAANQSCTREDGINRALAGARWTLGTSGPQRARAVVQVTDELGTYTLGTTFTAQLAAPQPTIALTVAPNELELAPGASAVIAVEINRTGTVGAVSLGLTSSGAVTGVFSPLEVPPSAGSATLTLTAAAEAAPGEYDLTVTGTASAGSASPATATIKVTVPLTAPTPTVIEDDTFADAEWEIVQALSTGGGTQSASQALQNGNPGAFRSMHHSAPVTEEVYDHGCHCFIHTPSTINVRHRFSAPRGEYDPRLPTTGAISRIDFAMDRRVISASAGSGGAVGHGFLLFQNDVIFWADLGAFSNTAWETREVVALTQQDFRNSAGGNPDFSANGAPITFGYLRSNSNTGQSADVEIGHGIDNWRVTIHRTP